jgi:hypothetical protein
MHPEVDMSGTPTETLLAAIRDKRATVDAYLRSAGSTQRRLVTIAVVGGALAASLTAGPAIGGKRFSDWLAHLSGLNTPAWQILCAAAAVCSLAAVIATQLLKSQGLDEHVARAHEERARLEWLDLSLATGLASHADAAAEYHKCVESLSFLDEARTPSGRQLSA